jgi:2-polyprenyl-3-methyl-5-hydroxy-6-metoxy-1,4-benzoquinol methylase/Tfp pilus assembly protein PilF
MSNPLSNSDNQQQLTVDEAYRQACIHFEAQRYTDADKLCTVILQVVPNHINAINLLGVVAQQIDRNELAVGQFQKAINIDNSIAFLYYNLATSLYPLGQIDDVVKALKRAIAIQPNYVEAYSSLGNALTDLGKLEEAVLCLEKAISIKPDYADSHTNLGNALKQQGKPEEAVTSYQKAISIKPENDIYWAAFAQCVKNMNFTHCNESFFTLLFQTLNQPNVSPQDISGAVIRALKCHTTFSDALKISSSGQVDKNIDYLTEQLATIPLLLRLIELCVIKDVDVEQLLTQTRRAVLNNISSKNDTTKSLPFYAALAMHCFTNEYVFSESVDEKTKVEHLQKQVELLICNDKIVPAKWIALLAAYRPLHSFSWSGKLLENEDLSKEMQKLIIKQIKEPLEEKALGLEIPSLAEIKDTVSKAVRNQYEVNPYPRWIRISTGSRPMGIKQLLQNLKLNININEQNFPENLDILDAGCGTGRFILAERSRLLNCSILAVDLSLSSLSYAKRKSQEMGVTNIEYLHGDILELNNLAQTFDIITSMGVLHHMDDPLQGWKVLVDLLRPKGLMKIGLYSKIARQNIIEAKRVIAEKKYTTSPDDIRKCRKEIIDTVHNVDSEIIKTLNFRDFFSLSECRDLLFHVQEHQFTLPQIDITLKNLGLRFIGFEMQDSRVMNNFKKTYPEKSAIFSLSLWNKFEIQNPDIFSGMYQFWVQKI